MGVTDYAQQALGDVVYVELPAVDSIVEAGSKPLPFPFSLRSP